MSSAIPVKSMLIDSERMLKAQIDWIMECLSEVQAEVMQGQDDDDIVFNHEFAVCSDVEEGVRARCLQHGFALQEVYYDSDLKVYVWDARRLTAKERAGRRKA